MSVSIAFAIPNQSITAIRDMMRSYQDVLTASIPQEHWHCELVAIEHATLTPEQLIILTQPIRQSFHPVVNILSLGLGKEPGQLWAYVQVQQFLEDIRAEIIERLNECDIATADAAFAPHIHVGNTEAAAIPLLIPDVPVKTKFSLGELVILQHNEQLGTIPITA